MVLRDLVRAIEAVEPRSAVVEAEGEPTASFELLVEADGVGAPIPTFESEGTLQETPSRFGSSGSFRVGGEARDETHEISLLEGGERLSGEGREGKKERVRGDNDKTEGYVLEGSHVVGGETSLATLLSSVDGVRQLVVSALGVLSDRLGSVVDTEVVEHTADHGTRDGRDIVDAEYTVLLTGLDRFVESSEMEARELHELREARRESGFACELGWRAKHTEKIISAEARYETENASRYADELRNRGVETPSGTSFTFELDTRGSTTAASFDSETHGGTPSSFGEGLEAWLAFLPLPAAFVYLQLPELHPTDSF